MHLEKLEIQGFKSFANKNTLVFSGLAKDQKRNLTAIVGPNGSGKSNIADAVRWALGEQSTKALRGKKSEDVIFSGSDKKGQLGLAEVSLHLNNEASIKTNDPNSPLQYSQIVITRRLFRNGDSEYLINNQRVRLTDIQLLLAKANFGQKTYSVIGQGIVENFLSTSPAERKDFFDEATGVKQFQIKRDLSLNKLQHSHENVEQAQMLLGEIEPRLKSLTRQVEKLQKRETLETNLKNLQLQYYNQIYRHLNKSLGSLNQEFLGWEKQEREKNKELDKLNENLKQIENSSQDEEKKISLRQKLREIREEIERNNRSLAQIEARIEISLEAQGKFDLSWLFKKQTELKESLETISQDLATAENVIADKKQGLTTTDVSNIDKSINELNQKSLELSRKQPELKPVLEIFWKKFNNLNIDDENLKNKLQELKKEFKNQISPFLNADNTNQPMNEKLESLQKEIIELTQKKQDLIQKNQEKRLDLVIWEQKINFKKEQRRQIQTELDDVINKIGSQENKEDSSELKKQKISYLEKIGNLKDQEDKLNTQLQALDSQDKHQRQQIFSWQRQGQESQRELNELNAKLNDLKVKAAKKETRLEDLEQDIREESLSLNEIKEVTIEEDFNSHEAEEKIHKFKKQLEMIGGIDPETENEFQETKKRYNFLKTQSDDLYETIVSLEKVIVELDQTIKEQFDKEFKVIDKKFSEYFKQLFNGGHAQLSKVLAEDNDNEEEKDESKKIKFLKNHNATGLIGIDIKATPPGKKIKVITMLSGGERALTAIALICAIISANPSPFVVLDEVDAALDEANSERLAQILDDLSYKTQFIVVTHNRASMRRAGLLYGVTMGDDGVSKLLSIKLEDVSTPGDLEKLSKNKS